MHCPRLYLALLLPFFVVPATAVPAASAATQAFGLDNALQLGAEGHFLPLAPDPVPAASEPVTNGERFKRGLPPAAPKKRGYRALVAPRTGRIRINKVSDGSLIGYAAPSTGYSSVVGAKGTGSTGSFGLSISAADGTTQTEISIVSTPNSVYSNLYLGGAGDDMISPANTHNLLAGVAHTTPGSTSQPFMTTYYTKRVESSIFTIGINGAITATWINTNGASQPTFLCYVESNDYLTLASNNVSACQLAVTWTFVEGL